MKRKLKKTLLYLFAILFLLIEIQHLNIVQRRNEGALGSQKSTYLECIIFVPYYIIKELIE